MLINHSTCQIKAPLQEQDLTGKRFGRLTALYHGHHGPFVVWHCLCDCGKTTITRAIRLIHNQTKSCGCANVHPKTHGMTKTPTWGSWKAMRGRVSNPNTAGYKRYGGRGITIDPRWQKFENFLADMGECPSSEYSLDRIDPNGNYERGNCRWATAKEQAVNRTNTVRLLYQGNNLTLDEWAELTGLHRQTIRDRVFKYQWTVEQALSLAPRPESQRKKQRKPPQTAQ